MNSLRKRNNRKHEGEYLWTYPQRTNKDGSEYYACQYVTIKDSREKTVTRGLGRPGTAKYNTNLARYEHLAKQSFRERMRNATNSL